VAVSVRIKKEGQEASQHPVWQYTLPLSGTVISWAYEDNQRSQLWFKNYICLLLTPYLSPPLDLVNPVIHSHIVVQWYEHLVSAVSREARLLITVSYSFFSELFVGNTANTEACRKTWSRTCSVHLVTSHMLHQLQIRCVL